MNSYKISIIAAVAANRVIGRDNQMPWLLPADLQYFKSLTWGNIVVMGRNTFESLGKPLPGRVNIVFSGRIINAEVWRVNDLAEFFALLEEKDSSGDWRDKEVFIIGGAELYNLFLPYTSRLYITKLYEEFPGDTYFPEIEKAGWQLVSVTKGVRDAENIYEHDYLIYEKKK